MGSLQPREWRLVRPRIGVSREVWVSALLGQPWFWLEWWGLAEGLRLYVSVPSWVSLKRAAVLVEGEPPGVPDRYYYAELQQDPGEYYLPLEFTGSLEDVLAQLVEGELVQIVGWVDRKAVRKLRGEAARLVRLPGEGPGSKMLAEMLDGILGYDPKDRYRLERYRRDPALVEERRELSRLVRDRLRSAPVFIVRARVYSPSRGRALELAEALASRFSRPLRLHAPRFMRSVGRTARRAPGPSGLLGGPDRRLLWMTRRELEPLVSPPDPSLVRIEFARGSPLPVVAPRRRGDVRFGTLEDGRVFAVDLEDLYRHLWTIGMTGTGKSTFLWNLALRLHATGRAAVVVIDPHGDVALDILESVPSLEGVEFFDPFLRPFALNPLELPRARDRGHAVALAVDQVIAIFERVLGLPETAVNVRYLLQVLMRMFYERTDSPTLGDLYNAIVALKMGELDLPVDDPQWSHQLELLRKLQDQTFLSALSRLEPYASNPLLRRLTSESTLDLDELLRPGRLVVFRLPKGELGEGVLQLLAPAIVLKLWFYVLERAMLGRERTPIFVVIDEFQNLAGLPVVETILSEARKYGLHLVMAHQHTRQLPEELLQSVFSNTAVKVVFQVGGGDVQRLGQLDRDFADAVRRALTALTVGQAVVKVTARPGEEQPPPVVVRMDPPPGRVRSWRAAVAGLPPVRPPGDARAAAPADLLNPVLGLLPPPHERLGPEELLVLYRVWRASRGGRETVEWSRVLAGLGLRRQRAEEARDSLAARGYIEAYKEGNKWVVRYLRGLFRGLKAVAPSREGRRLAARAMLWYLERGFYVVPARQAGPAAPDLVAIPYDRAQLRLRYGEAVAVEVESCNEVETHPEQVARNLVKNWELARKGVIRRVDFWTSSQCAERLSRILEEAARQNRIPREAYQAHTVDLDKPSRTRGPSREKPEPQPEQPSQPEQKQPAEKPSQPQETRRDQQPDDTVTIQIQGHTIRLTRTQYQQYKKLILKGWKPTITQNGQIKLTGPKGQTHTINPNPQNPDKP